MEINEALIKKAAEHVMLNSCSVQTLQESLRE